MNEGFSADMTIHKETGSTGQAAIPLELHVAMFRYFCLFLLVEDTEQKTHRSGNLLGSLHNKKSY